MKFRSKQFWVAVLVLCAAVCLIAALALLLPRGGQPVQPAPTPSPTAVPLPEPVPEGTPEPEPTASAIPEEVDGLPVGKWVITAERKAYVEDSLTLYLPAIQITRAVHDGTDAATLNRGVGLYEYAQLPGEGNRNVSLAGHRNGLDKNGNITDHAPFYYVDQLGEGDYLYLYDSQHVYRYLYDDTWVVEAPWLQQLIASVNFGDFESRNWFDKMLRQSGLFDRLEEMGIQDGDTVSLYNLEFEYQR